MLCYVISYVDFPDFSCTLRSSRIGKTHQRLRSANDDTRHSGNGWLPACRFVKFLTKLVLRLPCKLKLNSTKDRISYRILCDPLRVPLNPQWVHVRKLHSRSLGFKLHSSLFEYIIQGYVNKFFIFVCMTVCKNGSLTMF